MLEYTRRGFPIIYFDDDNGEKCTIQISSAYREETLIWLGCDEIGLKKFVPYKGWRDINTSAQGEVSYVANNRMHLTQSTVAKLLPILQHFAETGELPGKAVKDKQYATRDGIPAKFVEYRTRGSKLSVWDINGVETIRLADGSYRFDGKPSPYDIIEREQDGTD